MVLALHMAAISEFADGRYAAAVFLLFVQFDCLFLAAAQSRFFIIIRAAKTINTSVA